MDKKYKTISIFIATILSILILIFYLIQTPDPKDVVYGYADLVDPEMAPEPNHAAVLHGFHIMEETTKYAPTYAGDKITCNNCHFDGGNTLGGKNNGIPLVGVAQKYPVYMEMDGKTMSLSDRISNCFRRSLNGKAPPSTSDEMKSLIAYFDWISSPVANQKERPWLGLKPLKIKYAGSPDQGKLEYDRHCASCHGTKGEGSVSEEGNNIPPLWGSEAFNNGAGMNNPTNFASFIYWNMPFQQPYLTEKQAIDIAAFVTQQPRPHYVE